MFIFYESSDRKINKCIGREHTYTLAKPVRINVNAWTTDKANADYSVLCTTQSILRILNEIVHSDNADNLTGIDYDNMEITESVTESSIF